MRSSAIALVSIFALLMVASSAGAGQRSRSLDSPARMAADEASVPFMSLRATAKADARPSGRRRPRIVVHPHDIAVAAGRLAGFTAAASGVPAPKPQWQRSANRGRTWTNIRGAHRVTLTFTANRAQSGSEYRAVFTNAAGRAITSVARLTVGAPRSDPGHPTSPTGNGSSSSGGDSGSSDGATGSSGSGTLPVAAPPSDTAPGVTTQPSNETVVGGNNVTFTAAASGTPAPAAQWEASGNGGQTWTAIVNANSATYTFKPSSTQNANEYRAVFTNRAGVATTSAATLVVAAYSGNWAGHIALGQGFSSVVGSWNVPAVTCAGIETAYSSQWVGIDGVEDSSVEHDGTASDCVDGVPTYSAWYAMYGDSAVNGGDEVELSRSSYAVAPGDAMTASVSISGSTWTLAISDSTAGWQYSTDIPSPSPAPQQSSAEWIVERPAEGGALPALSDFGTTSFTGAAATDSAASGPISAFSDMPSEMVDPSGTPLATPGLLGSGGAGFAVTWNAAS